MECINTVKDREINFGLLYNHGKSKLKLKLQIRDFRDFEITQYQKV